MMGRKRVEVKKQKKQGQEIVTNMVTVNPTISEITLNVKDLSVSIKNKDKEYQKIRPNYMLSTRNPF